MRQFEMYDLNGKVALITGAARGQGASEAELFVKHGAKVMLTDTRREEGIATAERLGTSAMYSDLNVTQENEWSNVVRQTVEKFGRLDILVNNAGVSHFGSLQETSISDFRSVFQVNVEGVFLGMRAASP